MEADRAAQIKHVVPRLLIGLVAVESFTLPIFRSGGRTGLSFWQWVVNHSVFGPAVEYVPQEDYARELEGTLPGYPVKEHAETFGTMEEAMAYFHTDERTVRELVKHGAVSVVAGAATFRRYEDLLADVRHDGQYHPIRALVQPDEPEVREVARVLVQTGDFISAAQEFVNSFTSYEREQGDYWAMPAETLAARAGDCDDKGILLCSILRNYIPAEEVYCAFGLWDVRGETTGHMWVLVGGEGGEDCIIEATAGPSATGKGRYVIHGIFNDKYAFATDIGLREFDLRPAMLAAAAIRRW